MLLGGDLNAYSVARAFYEAYGATSHVFCAGRLGGTDNADFITLHVVEGLDDVNVAVPALIAFSLEHRDSELILVPCADWYMEILEFARERLIGHFSFNIPSFELWRIASDKVSLLTLFKKYKIEHPRSLSFRINDSILKDGAKLRAPFVIKPAESALYHKYDFCTKEKVYFADDISECVKIARKIFDSGYGGALILQERVGRTNSPPISSVLTTYSTKEGRVVMACLADAVLEESAPTARGNYAALVTRPLSPLSRRLISMLDELGYTGFANFDILSDKDGEVCLEINPRQGRSCDYLRAAGINIASLLCEDVLGREIKPVWEYPRVLWHAAPLSVVKKYGTRALRGSAERLIHLGAHQSAFSKKRSARRIFYDVAHAIRLKGKFKRYSRGAV